MGASLAGGVVLALMAASGAPSPHPMARLSYVRGPGAEACPDEQALRSAISARLGYEPFDDSASMSIATTVNPTARGLEAHIEIKGKGERRLASVSPDCVELASAIALAVSIAIDPMSLTREVAPAPPPAPEEKPSAPEVKAPIAPVPPVPVPSEPVRFSAHAGGLVSVNSAPIVAGGIIFGARARWTFFSLALEGRIDLPAGAHSTLGTFHTSLLMGSILPCFHRSVFGICAVASAGALRAEGDDLSASQNATLLYVALGARVVTEWELPHSFFDRIHLEGDAPLVRSLLQIGQAVVWSTPPISASLGLGAGLFF